MTANVLIEASAGTGKTQKLAERLIDLIRSGLKPHEIVALTFSRAAAGEIFERFVTLLAAHAADNPSDATLLREVIATQHLSQIGTLDSFLMRIVRSFPLELGLSGRLTMMDDYEASAERSRVSFGILRRTDAAVKRAFDEAFMLAMNRENVRSFSDTYRDFIATWHKRFLAQPDPQAWGDAAQMGLASFVSTDATPADALASAAATLEGIVDSDAWREFASWVRNFRGSFTGVKGFAKKFIDMGDTLFAGATVEVSLNRRQYAFGGAQAAAIRAAITATLAYVVRMKLEVARGIYTLVSSFEDDYAKKVRRAGRLVFDDVPRLVCGLREDVRLALEYRMDAKIRAWALDEFQDTSREQWKAIGNLIDEAKQSDGEKSLFVVGDRKQAIYGWRNGDVRIFTHERMSGVYDVGELSKSWRYGEPIVQAVNAIFVYGRLKDEFPAWEAPVHGTAKPELGGFVQTVESPGAKAEDFVVPVFNALAAVDPIRRGISAAVLVRTNSFGEQLAADLKRLGLRGVVWEGESDILDTPALAAFADTLSIADHPGDRQAYEHFRRSPLARAKYGESIPSAEEISGEFALSFATKGFVRTFRDLRACLPKDPKDAWSEFTESRFTDMLRAAAEFERTMEPGMRIGDFVAFLNAKKKRNVAEPGKIKIMTIHRSKGLGFDYVVLPLYEHDALDAEPDGPLVADGWVLPDPGVRVTHAVSALRDAWRMRKDRSEQESLCLYYVAMTRAKRAMTIVLHPPSKTSTARRISEFVREALPAPIGEPNWYEHVPSAASTPAGESGLSAEWNVARASRHAVRRRLPSLSFQTGERAGNLFAAVGARKSARAAGVAAHAEYERIEWLASDRATTALERALVKPTGAVALWRERAFEVFADGEWTSGRFDRVVFAGGKAVIYDFKTNARHRGEGDVSFARRLAETYAGQMSAYRKSLAALTGLAPADISTVLLATATGAAIAVP